MTTVNDQQQSISSTSSRYKFSGAQVIEERSASIWCQYVWGLGYVNDLVLRDRNADHNSATGGYGLNGDGLDEREYAQQDANWNVISLTSGSGSQTQRFIYDAYGQQTFLTAGTWAVTSNPGSSWLYGFQGMRLLYSTQSNLWMSQSRFYDSGLGVWTTKDPAGYVDGMNGYRAFDSNPASVIDPSGMNSQTFPISFQQKHIIDATVSVESHLREEVPYVNLGLSLTRLFTPQAIEDWNDINEDRKHQVPNVPGGPNDSRIIGPNFASYLNNGYNPGVGRDHPIDDQAVVFIEDWRERGGALQQVSGPLISGVWTAPGNQNNLNNPDAIINEVYNGKFTMLLPECEDKGVWKIFLYYLNTNIRVANGDQVLAEYDIDWSFRRNSIFTYGIARGKRQEPDYDFDAWRNLDPKSPTGPAPTLDETLQDFID